MSHFYDNEGNPHHYIVGANGKERASTLRDARKHNWLPSVTGIIDILDKPGLNRWFQDKITLACLTLPRPEDISDDEFLKIVRQDAAEEAEQAKLRGNEIHNCLEAIYGDNEPEVWEAKEDIFAISCAAHLAVNEYCKTQNFTPEKILVGDGYAGTCDLHNDEWICDYKTKQITDKQFEDYQSGKNPRLAYPEMAMQLSAYDRALGGAQRTAINVFIDREIPGRVIIHQWSAEEMAEAWRKFELLLELWQISKNYYPNHGRQSCTH